VEKNSTHSNRKTAMEKDTNNNWKKTTKITKRKQTGRNNKQPLLYNPKKSPQPTKDTLHTKK